MILLMPRDTVIKNKRNMKTDRADGGSIEIKHPLVSSLISYKLINRQFILNG